MAKKRKLLTKEEYCSLLYTLQLLPSEILKERTGMDDQWYIDTFWYSYEECVDIVHDRKNYTRIRCPSPSKYKWLCTPILFQPKHNTLPNPTPTYYKGRNSTLLHHYWVNHFTLHILRELITPYIKWKFVHFSPTWFWYMLKTKSSLLFTDLTNTPLRRWVMLKQYYIKERLIKFPFVSSTPEIIINIKQLLPDNEIIKLDHTVKHNYLTPRVFADPTPVCFIESDYDPVFVYKHFVLKIARQSTLSYEIFFQLIVSMAGLRQDYNPKITIHHKLPYAECIKNQEAYYTSYNKQRKELEKAASIIADMHVPLSFRVNNNKILNQPTVLEILSYVYLYNNVTILTPTY